MEEDLKQVVSVLKKGGIILYPTDTIWGIGCDATNASAVKRVYEIKQREDTKSMLILVKDTDMLSRYVEEVPAIALDLIRLSEKPITIIYSGATGPAANLIAGDGSIGIRVTTDPFCAAMIRLLGRPIVSTSANISGAPAPDNFSGISRDILDKMDYVVRYRQEEMKKGKASPVIRVWSNGEIKIFRE